MPFRACKSHSFLKDSFFLFNVCRRFLTYLLGNTLPDCQIPSKSLASIPRSSSIKLLRLASTRSSRNGKKVNRPRLKPANNSHTSSSWSSLPTNSLRPFVGSKRKISSSLHSTSGTSYPESQIRGTGWVGQQDMRYSLSVKEIYYQYGDDAEAPPTEFASDAARSRLQCWRTRI